MKDDITHILFSTLRSVFHGNQMSDTDKKSVTKEALPELMRIAQKHDIAHLTALGLLNNKLVDPEIKPQIQMFTFTAAFRYEKLNYELKRACDTLEKAKIPFIPLKGAVMRKYYPEPWMRTGCDIDILVHKKDLKNAVSYLVENLEYTKHRQNSHDVSLFTTSGTHIELHYELIENGLANSASKILADVWDTVTPKEGCSYYYEMPDDMFYFYHIAHMAKHFENGGCGIRPLIDLYILDSIMGADIEKRDALLEKGKLLRFAQMARKLSRVWLENDRLDYVTEKMQRYIIRGGLYGTNENRIAVQQQKKGGKLQYALSKIVIPYNTIKFHYPILQKHRWLTPIMQVRRWGKLVFCGHAKRAICELLYNKSISKSQADDIKVFLSEVGLQIKN